MNNKARTLWTTLAAVLIGALALVTVAAQAQEPRQPAPDRQAHGRVFGPGRGMGLGPGLARLNLTEQQREQIHAIRQEARSSSEAPETNVGALQRELRAAIFADTPDHAKIDQLKASIAEAQASALDARIAVDLKIAAVLTPEQRAQARELPARGPGRGQGRGMRR
jgi:Spy/CpxP family protein refolding chaperone